MLIEPVFGSVRLSDGSSGRLEVAHDGTTGTVCGHNWIDTNCRVVCRTLGYS